MEGFARMQRGMAGDITAGLPLGLWTPAIADKLIAQHELVWEEAGISQAERDSQRQQFAEHYRKHIDAGELYYPYVPYPYIEWYSKNGRVVLELDVSQVEIVESARVREKSARELAADGRRRKSAMEAFLGGLVRGISRKNRKQGGDGKAFRALTE